MKNLHIIYIPFTDVGVGTQFRDEEWLDYRARIFFDYTLQSILNQSKKDFILWLSFTYRERENPIVEDLLRSIERKGIRCIATYNGLMYWDDKFGGNLWQKAKNIARVFRRCWRNKNWSECLPLLRELRKNEQKNNTLYIRIAHALPSLFYGIPDYTAYDWVYLTRLDSDDMIHKDVVREIQEIPPEVGAITMSKGFVYNVQTKQLAHWLPLTNPPFHTIVFPGEVFFDARKHLAWYKDFQSHEDIPRIFPNYYPMHNWRYCVLVHSGVNQISTNFNHPFRGYEIVAGKSGYLKDFGL